MKIVKRILLNGEDRDLVAFITDGKKPMAFICRDWYSEFDGTDPYDLEEWLLRIPLVELKKITRTRLPVKKGSKKR